MSHARTRAIVTGHSRGLGAGIARALLERGVKVLGLSRRTASAPEGVPAGLLEEQALDLADPAALSDWLAAGGLERFLADAELALLVNNAGVVSPIGPLPTQPGDEVARAVALNVTAPLLLSAAFAQARTPAAERRILHVSSGAGRTPYPGWSVYCATKAALDQHARCVELDAAPGLRICSLAPGVIDTGMQGEIRATDPARFPMHERFVGMARQGALADPVQCGARIADHLLGEAFGASAVADLRELGGG
jgi:NAD(P)-dependent dehydrogenase (short-subunit alcohol dehydrogenase family)